MTATRSSTSPWKTASCAAAAPRPVQDGHQFIGAIDFLGAGSASRIGTFMDRPLIESVCTTCGQCLSVCPTGAIEVKSPVEKIVRTTTTTCPYCVVGCGIKAQVDDQRAHGRHAGRPGQRVQRGHALRKGPLRLHVRPARGPADDAVDTQERQANASVLGRGPRSRGRAPGRVSRRRLRHTVLCQGHQRGRLRPTEVRPPC